MKRQGTRKGGGNSTGDWMRDEAGFSLAELLLVCLLASLVGSLVLGLLLVLQRGLVPQRLVCGGEVLAQAPCFEVLPAALALHSAFRRQISRCTAAYVFGGRVGAASEGWAGGRVLALGGLPSLGVMEQGFPENSGLLAQVQLSHLGGEVRGQGAEDFSVLLLGRGPQGPIALCLVQCRSTEFQAAQGGAWKRREVRLWAEGGEELSYVFAESVEAKLFCGALHSWYRPFVSEGVAEAGPATLVFPDPWVFAGTRSGFSEDPAGSRFSYFLPVFP